MKMFWFFSATTEIPWTFKLCGIFQMCCDSILCGQFLLYGDGDSTKNYKDHHTLGLRNGGTRTPMNEKDARLG